MCSKKVVRLAEDIDHETSVHTALLLCKVKALHGLGLLDAVQDILTGHCIDPGIC